MRVDVPARAGSASDAEEIDCSSPSSCTITTLMGGGRGTRTTVSAGRGGGQGVTVTTGPVRTTARARTGTTVRASSASGASTTTVNTGAGQAVTTTVATGAARGSATTIDAWDGSTPRDRDGFAFATGDVEGRIAALRAMARNAPPEAAADGLARLAYSDEDVRVQRAAVEELGKMRTRESVKQLGRISRRHPDASVRAQAAAAIR
jgi:hypothetical protein